MRWQLVVCAIAIAAPASANRPSNPAFLGISMADRTTNPAIQIDGCWVETVTPASAAEGAGLRQGDVIQRIDAGAITVCAELTAAIQDHAPGDLIQIAVVRNGERAVVRAALSSRAEILHRRFVDHALESTRAVAVEDSRELDLEDLRGATTILAWFDTSRCTGCGALLEQLGDALHAQKRAAGVQIMAVTAGSVQDLAAKHQALHLGVPLVVVDPEQYTRAVTSDLDRIFIMVLDSRGVVRFVTPIAPEDDAVDATIDEVVAAAEQAEHARSRR